MRKTIIAGLTTALTTAAVAAPALAQSPSPSVVAPAPATQQNAADAPQLHVDTIKVQTSKRGYVIATVPLTAINMGKQTVYVQVHSNLKTFEPVTGGEFSGQTGIVGVPGNGKVYKVYSMRFAFNGKSGAQVRKSLKVSISNPTGGAVITDATASAS